MIVVAPSTAATGAGGMAELALDCLVPGRTLPDGARLVVSRLGGSTVATRRGRRWGWADRTNCCGWPTSWYAEADTGCCPSH